MQKRRAAAWYDENDETKTPSEDYVNSPCSVEDINAGAVAWLYKRGKGGLMAGSTVAEAKAFCQKTIFCSAFSKSK